MTRYLLAVVGLIACRDATPGASPGTRDSSVASASARAVRCELRASDGSCAQYVVPLVQLLARPMEFRGDDVRTQGYALLGPSGLSHLFPTQADREGGLLVNSIALVLPSDSVANRLSGRKGYVTVEGRYDTLSASEREYPFWKIGIRVQTIRGTRDITWGDWIDPNYQPKTMH